jgi:hypothetical protein
MTVPHENHSHPACDWVFTVQVDENCEKCTHLAKLEPLFMVVFHHNMITNEIVGIFPTLIDAVNMINSTYSNPHGYEIKEFEAGDTIRYLADDKYGGPGVSVHKIDIEKGGLLMYSGPTQD